MNKTVDTLPAFQHFDRLRSSKRAELTDFFELWRTVQAQADKRLVQNDVTSIVHMVPEDWLDATADGRYAAWLAANPVRKVG